MLTAFTHANDVHSLKWPNPSSEVAEETARVMQGPRPLASHHQPGGCACEKAHKAGPQGHSSHSGCEGVHTACHSDSQACAAGLQAAPHCLPAGPLAACSFRCCFVCKLYICLPLEAASVGCLAAATLAFI